MQNLTRNGVVPELSSFQCSQDQLKFSLSDQSIFNSNSTNIKKILFHAFFDGNTRADSEQLLGLNVIFAFLQQAFGLDVHFLLIFFISFFCIFATSFWTQCIFLADFAGKTY